MLELYEPLEQALAALEASSGAAAAHGQLCGMLTASEATERARWIAMVLEDTAPRGDAAKACLELLSQLYDETQQALADPELGWRVLLPGDAEPLAVRSVALGAWSEGYLLGLAVGGLTRETDLPDEAREILRDLAEIAQVESDPEDDEDNEHAYEELVEYVRMGTLLIREHVRGADSARRRPAGHARRPRLH
ncbi:MAG: UPF0149 family protein [Nitrococcus sp.]|nr:UPF0149 family protein [Nitrococcus sp.]